MDFQDIGVAIVGTGFMGPAHTEALRRLGIPIRGILGSSPAKSQKAAGQLGIVRAYGSFEELLADPSVDAVHITTPNKHHHAMVIAALDAKKHVLCEKPLAMNASESLKLVRQAKSSGLQAGVNYNIRFYPLCIEASVRDIGKIQSIQGSYVQDWLLYDTDYNWRVLAAEGGELRAIADIGTHWLDLVSFVTGLEVESVFADLKTVHPIRKRPKGEVETFASTKGLELIETEITTEDQGAVLLRFRGGAKGMLWVSQVTAGRKNRLEFEVAGKDGSMAWDSEDPNELWLGHRAKPNEILPKDPALLSPPAAYHASYPGGHAEGYPDSFKQCFKAFYDAVRGIPGPVAYPSFADGHREIQICEAILKSHRSGQWAKVEGDKCTSGFVTAILPELSLEEVLKTAGEIGYQSVEVMCWPRGKAERRYAGVTHIDVNDFSVEEVQGLCRSSGVSISGLGYYPNMLSADDNESRIAVEHFRSVIDASSVLGIGVANTFIGRDPKLTVDENWPKLMAIWPSLVQHAESKGVRIGIENCPMFFTGDEWPGGKNLATTPKIWRRLFEAIPSKNLGLNYDPSHLVWQMMDYSKPLTDFADRLVHVHAKDARINREALNDVGIMATPLEYHSPVLPGRGDIDWSRFFTALKATGYDGSVAVEVEDREYEGTLADRIKALKLAADFLLPLVGRQ